MLCQSTVVNWNTELVSGNKNVQCGSWENTCHNPFPCVVFFVKKWNDFFFQEKLQALLWDSKAQLATLNAKQKKILKRKGFSGEMFKCDAFEIKVWFGLTIVSKDVWPFVYFNGLFSRSRDPLYQKQGAELTQAQTLKKLWQALCAYVVHRIFIQIKFSPCNV